MGAQRTSGFVITYNRANLVETCLRSIRFVDDLTVIDKSSTDATVDIARRYADRVITVPWSPTVEETRRFALEQCRHDWIVFLDDDEMLSSAAIEYLRTVCDRDVPDVIALPLRHYILGRFDERAYYWPEHQIRCFRRGAVTFGSAVHGGLQVHSQHVEYAPADSAICIEHLSHTDTAQWIERTNRYTSQPNRVQAEASGENLIDFAHGRIDHWLARGKDHSGDSYPAAVALLRAVYDMVDRLKAWESAQGIDGAAAFRSRCTELGREYDALEMRLGIRTDMQR
jgi:glycosyltransferase involved in cell wall biosynthesis